MIDIQHTEAQKLDTYMTVEAFSDAAEEYSDYKIYQHLVRNGIIDIQQVRAEMEMAQKSKFLSMHEYSIYKGKDEKWYTYLPDEFKGRIKKKRNTREEIEDLVVEYWRSKCERVSLLDVFTEWNDRKLHLGKIQPATHSRNQRLFDRHFKAIQNQEIKGMSPVYLEDYLERQISEHGLTAKAFSNLKTVVRGFMKRAKKRGLVSFNVEEVFNEMDLTEREF